MDKSPVRVIRPDHASEIIISFGLKMMFQIIFIISSVKLSGKIKSVPRRDATSLAIFQIRKTLELLHRTFSFNPSYNFVQCLIGRRRNQNMDMGNLL